MATTMGNVDNGDFKSMTEQPQTITIINAATLALYPIGHEANGQPIFNIHPNVDIANTAGKMVCTVFRTETGNTHIISLIPPTDAENYIELDDVTEEHKIQWTRDAIDLWIAANTAKI